MKMKENNFLVYGKYYLLNECVLLNKMAYEDIIPNLEFSFQLNQGEKDENVYYISL